MTEERTNQYAAGATPPRTTSTSSSRRVRVPFDDRSTEHAPARSSSGARGQHVQSARTQDPSARTPRAQAQRAQASRTRAQRAQTGGRHAAETRQVSSRPSAQQSRHRQSQQVGQSESSRSAAAESRSRAVGQSGSGARRGAAGAQTGAHRAAQTGGMVPVQVGSRKPARERSSSTARAAAAATSGDNRRYVASVDGLRAFAVLAVIAYHMGLKWASGGLMGVTVFFVISGYLITGILMNELTTRGTIRLGRFWLRRIRRLFPAIVLVIGVVLILCALFNTTLLNKMKPDVLPSLFWLNNWWQIFHEISYFEAAGSPSPLTHFWSLAIEEQYYLICPIVLLLMYKAGASRKTFIRTFAVLAIVSALEMALLYDPHGDPSRVYYGTDTRAFSLLVGAWLALMWPSTAFGENAQHKVDKRTSLLFNFIGLLAMAGLIVVVVTTNGFSSFPYRGGTFLVSVLSAAVIAALVIPGTLLDRFFSLKPVVWIGKLSYSMYLWHFPILLLTTNVNSTVAVPWWMRVVQLVLIFAVSAASYYLVENPIRYGAIGNWWRAHKEGLPEGSMRRIAGPVGFTCALVLAASLAYAGALPSTAPAKPMIAQSSSTTSASSAGSQAATPSGTEQSSGSASSSGDARSADYFQQQHYNSAGAKVYEPLLIGDSVAAGCEEQFYAAFPYGYIDAIVARNVWESPYADYDQAGQVGQYVVFCLGTNNAVVDWQIDDELLNVVGSDKTVVFVNTRSPQSWTDSTNEVIAKIPERYPNVVVADWYAASAGHDEYFAGDGTHLTEEGARAYIDLIKQTLLDHMN